MGLLDGKQILVAGVTMNTSIGYSVARIAAEQGATVVVSNFGRAMSLTKRVIASLDPEPALIELDVSDPDHLTRLPDLLRAHVDRLDGVVHSIAYANPQTTFADSFLTAPWEDVGQSLQISAYSLASLTMACKPLFADRVSVVGLDFDNSVSWPVYGWMGVSKSALQSVSRYLARYLGGDGVRVNLVACGPLDTLSKKSIPGSEEFNRVWTERAPLGWDSRDYDVAGKAAVALLSDWFPATTGEIIHVDGGMHSTGA